MTINYPQALTAITSGSALWLRLAFESLTIAEMVELGTFIGPTRLRAVAASPAISTAFRPFGTTLDTISVLTEINFQAFNIASRALGPLRPDPTIAPTVRAGLLSVAARRRAGPLLRMTKDVAVVESGGRSGFDAAC